MQKLRAFQTASVCFRYLLQRGDTAGSAGGGPRRGSKWQPRSPPPGANLESQPHCGRWGREVSIGGLNDSGKKYNKD